MLMADAGLTNGAFDAHFASKDDLVAGVIAEQLGGQREAIAALPADSGIEQIVRGNLSVEHRDHPGEGARPRPCSMRSAAATTRSGGPTPTVRSVSWT